MKMGKKLPTKTQKRYDAMAVTDEDAKDPHRTNQLRYDRERFAEAIAKGCTRREAIKYARNDSLALTHMMDAMAVEPQVRRSIVERLEEKQHLILDYIDDLALDGADLGKLSAALGVITDRLRLYQGKATQIREDRKTLSDEEKEKIERILSRVAPVKVYEGEEIKTIDHGLTAAEGESVSSLSGSADAVPGLAAGHVESAIG